MKLNVMKSKEANEEKKLLNERKEVNIVHYGGRVTNLIKVNPLLP